MPMLFGRPIAEAKRHVGTWSQIARIDSFVEADGPGLGARRLRMITGGGLEVDIHPDRALDIGQVTIDGIPVAWMEPQGIVAPSFFDANGFGWSRTFGGGLLTTCGLDSYGLPCLDEGKEFGQHGRINAIPARIITTSCEDGLLVVEGLVRQSCIGGENLTLRRRIESVLGGRDIAITDVVTNESSHPVIHMMMYHSNFGWPLIEEGTSLSLPSQNVEPRDDTSANGLEHWNIVEPPSLANQSKVFLHDLNGEDLATVKIINNRIKLALTMTFDRRQLPWLCQWKFLSEDTYVVAIEPINTRTVTSRAHAREAGSLKSLAAKESITYTLKYSFDRLD